MNVEAVEQTYWRNPILRYTQHPLHSPLLPLPYGDVSVHCKCCPLLLIISFSIYFRMLRISLNQSSQTVFVFLNVTLSTQKGQIWKMNQHKHNFLKIKIKDETKTLLILLERHCYNFYTWCLSPPSAKRKGLHQPAG